MINMAENTCKNCKSEMKIVGEKIITGTKYKMFKCEKCNIRVAKSQR